MPKRIRSILIRLASFLVAGGLLYLALNGVDLQTVWTALKRADYRWALPAIAITLGSHLLRAWRWQLLLNALPPSGTNQKKSSHVPLKTAFGSLMIGYMVNYAAPRVGEVARSANLARRERLSFSSVLGTVAIERALDILIFFAALLSVSLLLSHQWPLVYSLFFAPVVTYAASFSLYWILGGAVGLLLIIGAGVGYWYRYHHHRFLSSTLWEEYLMPLVSAFKKGWNTLFHAPQRAGLLLSTVGMWFGYLLMAYLPLLMLDMAGTYNLSLIDTWAIMILGALGVLVPVPGGTGSYHYVTIQIMVHLFLVDQSSAATYAVLTHAGQMVLYIAVGLAFWFWQGASWKSLNSEPAEVSSPAARQN